MYDSPHDSTATAPNATSRKTPMPQQRFDDLQTFDGPPSWQVIGVFDPDGHAVDFSYTVGLAEHGHLDLHLYARPSDGHDPGADWAFSARDRGHLLNAIARRVLAGSLSVGDTWSDTYDAGAATATFRLDAPEPARDLEAYQASTDHVTPVRWSLHREPAGQLADATEDGAAAAQDLIDRLSPPNLLRHASLPPALRREPSASFHATQEFGPMTPVVRAYAADIAAASADQVTNLLFAASAADEAIGAAHVRALAAATARRTGRTNQLDAIHTLTSRVVAHLMAAGSPRYESILAVVVGDLTQLDADERDNAREWISDGLHNGIHSVLATAAVWDVADDPLRRAGTGPWEHARSGSPFAAGPLWCAPAATLETVRGLLGPLDRRALTTLARRHQTALAAAEDPTAVAAEATPSRQQTAPGVIGAERAATYNRVHTSVLGWTLTTASNIPALEQLLAGTPAGEHLRALGEEVGATRDGQDTVDSIEAVAGILAMALSGQVGIDHDAAAAVGQVLDEGTGPITQALAPAAAHEPSRDRA